MEPRAVQVLCSTFWALRCSSMLLLLLLLLLLHVSCVEPSESRDKVPAKPFNRTAPGGAHSDGAEWSSGAAASNASPDAAAAAAAAGAASASDATPKEGSASSSSNSRGGGAPLNLPQLLWEPLTNTAEARHLFEGCFAAEAPILLELGHRPLIKGLTPELHEVEE